MSAPVPLSSGCCASPCPTSPTVQVPGPAGENAFSFTVGSYVQPAVGFTVTVTLTHDGWVVPGQTVFILIGGFYTVTAISGLNITIQNIGGTNALAGVVIPSGSQVSPSGPPGFSGNAFTITTALYFQPLVGANVSVAVASSSWASIGQIVFVASGGYYTVFDTPDSAHLTLTNLGYPGNAAPITQITSPRTVSPAGLQGSAGPAGPANLNAASPTTTKGDLIVDNGVNHPLASDVRLGVGTDGQALVANSGQPTGLGYATITPNTAATTGDIAIFSGTTGTPLAVKDSKMLITTDGALQSTPTGGNARGSKAVDLQINRSANTQVASGASSTIAGGENNTASNTDSGVCCGNTNVASGSQSFVGGGFQNTASGGESAVCAGSNNTASNFASAVAAGSNNTASGNTAFVGGGTQNTASGTNSSVLSGNANNATAQYASVVGGNSNTASGQYSTVVGGNQAVAGLLGEISHASFIFAAAGDGQVNELIWGISTTDATANVEMFLDATATRAVLPNLATWAFDIYLIGRSSAGVGAVWHTQGGVQNIAGTVTLIAANTQSVIVDGTGGTWGVTGSFAVTADNVNKSLKLAVTGGVATNIRWVAHARIVQVIF